MVTTRRAAEAGGPPQPLQVVQAVLIALEPCLELAHGSWIVHAGARVIHRPSLHDGLRLNGYPRRVVICYVSPPGTLWSALYDRAGIEKKTAAPAEAVAQLHKAAERTGTVLSRRALVRA